MFSNHSTPAATRRRPIIAMIVAAATVTLPLILSQGATANPTASQCKSTNKSCVANCNRYTDGPFKTSCLKRCEAQLKECMVNPDGGPGKVETTPTPPKGTGDRAPPTGGTRSELKANGFSAVASSVAPQMENLP